MKKLFVLVISVLMLIGLTGCHGKMVKNDEEGSDEVIKDSFTFEVPDNFDESKNYEITFWAKNDSNKKQVDVYKQAIEEFESYYPNIKVNLKLYTDYTHIYNDVITNISTNTTPNVCITYPDHIATYLTGESTMVDLNGLMNDPEYGLGGSLIRFDAPKKSEIIKEFLDEGIINDKYYALPYMRSTEAFYINKDFVEKLGYEIPDTLTWDFVWEVSDAASKKDNDGTYLLNGQKTLIPFIYKSTDNMMISMLKQLGADYSNENGDILIFNDSTREVLEEIGKHVENGAFSTFKISSYPANFLNAGQCIFAIDSTAGATWMGCDAPLLDIPEENIVRFETVVKPIPQYDVNNPLMISQGPSICLFNKEDNQEVLASWLFAQYLLSNSIQCAYAETEGYVPVTSKAQNSDEYIDYINRQGEDNDEHYSVKIDASKLLMDNTSNTFVTPVFNGSASLRIAAGQLIEETCKGIRRNKVINDEFFDSLYEDIKSLYHLDQSNPSTNSTELGPLPQESKVLLITLVCVWIIIGLYFAYTKVRSRH